MGINRESEVKVGGGGWSGENKESRRVRRWGEIEMLML